MSDTLHKMLSLFEVKSKASKSEFGTEPTAPNTCNLSRKLNFDARLPLDDNITILVTSFFTPHSQPKASQVAISPKTRKHSLASKQHRTSAREVQHMGTTFRRRSQTYFKEELGNGKSALGGQLAPLSENEVASRRARNDDLPNSKGYSHIIDFAYKPRRQFLDGSGRRNAFVVCAGSHPSWRVKGVKTYLWPKSPGLRTQAESGGTQGRAPPVSQPVDPAQVRQAPHALPIRPKRARSVSPADAPEDAVKRQRRVLPAQYESRTVEMPLRLKTEIVGQDQYLRDFSTVTRAEIGHELPELALRPKPTSPRDNIDTSESTTILP